MKIIAYSQVPQKHAYVHLAYLSAAAQNAAAGRLAAGLGLVMIFFLLIATATALKIPMKFPRTWRWTMISILAIILGLIVLVWYSHVNNLGYETLH